MDSAVLSMTGALADQLAANDQAPVVDPRDVPLRFSTLKQIRVSPAHYRHAVLTGYDETLSMRIGSGAHAILFGTPYVVWTGKTRQGKAWEAFEAEHDGELILSRSELAKAKAMAEAIKSSETAMRLLFTGTKLETRIDWKWQGRQMRSTPDAAGRTHIVDLKCLRSADPNEVMWQSRKMAYHVQAAMYRRALNSTGEHNIKECFLVVVENKPPHPVTVLRFTAAALAAGDSTSSNWLAEVLTCEASGIYPGYVQHVVDLDLPVTESDLTFGDDDEEE